MKFAHLCFILTLLQRGSGMSDLSYKKQIRPISRVVGGRLARIQDFPSTACLILKSSERDDFRGGAVIISESWAITAAHCMSFINSDDVANGIAFVRSNSANWQEHYNDHTIIEKYVHEKYDYTLTDYDIALLKVKQPFNSPNEKPATLLNSNYKYVEDTIATVVGWGTTDPEAIEPFVVDNLRFVNIRITNFDTCKNTYNASDEEITDRMICAFSPGKDACVYDSGGPLYQNNLLIGLVSWGGPTCADKLLPGVYTKLSVFVNWVKEKVSENINIG